MGFGDRSGSSPIAFILNAVLRFLQFVFAITVIGLYAQDVRKAHKYHVHIPSKWPFAVAVGALSAFTSLVYGIIPLILSASSIAVLFAWDFILFILWTTVFGLFGKMFIHEHVEMEPGIQRMKNAVWIDLVNMLLWLVSTIVGAIGFWRWMRGGRSLHTGRATV